MYPYSYMYCAPHRDRVLHRFDPFLFYFGLSGIALRFYPFLFISSSLALHSNFIPSFYYGFSSIEVGIDPFILIRFLWQCIFIRSLPFVSGSPASQRDSIPSLCFGFSGIAPRFVSFVLIQILWHCAQIRSRPFVRVLQYCIQIRYLPFIPGSPTSHWDSIPSFSFEFSAIPPRFAPFVYFGFFGIAPKCDPFSLYEVLKYRARIRSL